jgi:hypothetical protein
LRPLISTTDLHQIINDSDTLVVDTSSFLGGTEKNEEDLKNLSKRMMNDVVSLHVMVNGNEFPIDLRNFRFQSPVLDIILPPDNIFGINEGLTKVVTDGFWIFFHPKYHMQ